MNRCQYRINDRASHAALICFCAILIIASSSATIHAQDPVAAGVADVPDRKPGVTIHIDRDEPIWSDGEPVVFTLQVTQVPLPDRCYWRIVDTQGLEIYGAWAALDEQGHVSVDVTGIEPNFYRLRVGPDPDKESWSGQDFVLLSAQDHSIGPGKSIFGIFGAQEEEELELAKRMGVSWTIGNIPWTYYQRDPDKPPHLDGVLAALGKTRQYGIEPIALIDATPNWANGNGEPAAPPLPAFYDRWEQYNQDIARASAGIVTWFQSWNEPNNPAGLNLENAQTTLDRISLAKLLQRMQYEGLTRGNPDAKLIGGCFADAPIDWFKAWLSPPNDLRKFQDAMSAHPYCPAGEADGWIHRSPPEPKLIEDLRACREVMDANGAAGTPLFWTEFGWRSDYVSEPEYARWVARHMTITAAYERQTKTLAACLFSMGPQSGYGIVRKSDEVTKGGHRLRQPVGGYATTAGVLRGATFQGVLREDTEGGVYAYIFRKGDQRIIAAWTTEASRERTIHLPMSRARTYLSIAVLGNETLRVAEPGATIQLPDLGDPVYLVLHEEPTLCWSTRFVPVTVRTTQPQTQVTVSLGNLGPRAVDARILTDAPWITIPANRSVSPARLDDVTLAIDATGLALGVYDAQITTDPRSRPLHLQLNVLRD